MNTKIVPIGCAAICVALLCAIAIAAHAATITVINTNDSGPGSLRQALADANDGDTINFDPALNGQTINLTSGELVIGKDITIDGPGSRYAISMLNSPAADRTDPLNWTKIGENNRPAPSGAAWWKLLSSDIQLSTTGFNDVDCANAALALVADAAPTK